MPYQNVQYFETYRDLNIEWEYIKKSSMTMYISSILLFVA